MMLFLLDTFLFFSTKVLRNEMHFFTSSFLLLQGNNIARS